MTIIMQIYLTISLVLITLLIVAAIFYKISEDTWHDTLETVFGIIVIISFILTCSWLLYILLAIIWHWY